MFEMRKTSDSVQLRNSTLAARKSKEQWLHRAPLYCRTLTEHNDGLCLFYRVETRDLYQPRVEKGWSQESYAERNQGS